MSSLQDSFSKYRKVNASSYITSDESDDDDECVVDSPNNSNSKSKSICISESDSEDDFIIGSKKRVKPIISDSDSDDEENSDTENRSFSPRTRLSITGIRPRDIPSDESEIEYEDSTIAKTNHSTYTADISKSSEQNTENVATNNDTVESDGIFCGSPVPNRFSKKFNSSISNKLSSTITDFSPVSEKEVSGHESSSKTDTKSIELLTFEEPTIEISSESDTSSPLFSTNNSTKTSTLIQPKILKSVQNMPPPTFNKIPTFVSEKFLNEELRKLENLKLELETCKNLIKSKGILPDGGKKILQRIEILKNEIKKQANIVSELVIEEQDVKQNIAHNKGGKCPGSPTWEDIANSANSIVAVHTGKRGIATFTAQKSLTIDRLKDIHCSLETCPGEEVLASDPAGLKISLMNHQRSALTWMEWREKQKPRGGILADDMGLGKTLTMISLIIQSKIFEEANEQTHSTDDEESEENPNKGWSAKGRKDYYDGGTLVVAPCSLIKQWEEEVKNRTKKNLLSICVHHGTNRDAKPRHLAKYDIVVTTYTLVSREFKTTNTLFQIKWKRIILDEAHVVRNHKSQTSVGVCGLKGKYKWALTGTPIQNKEMDLYALLKFLKCSPFDDLSHWKRWIDNKTAGGQQRLNTLMKSLMLRRTKIQLQEKGELIALPSKSITLVEVTLDKEEMNVYQKIMVFSRTLFAQYLHQRAEKDHDNYHSENTNSAAFMKVPSDPNGAYSKMHQKLSRLHGNANVQSHEILVLLLRLRQICCHPGLIDAMLEDETDLSINIQNDDRTNKSKNDIDLLEQLEKLQIKNDDTSESESLENSNPNLDGSNDIKMSKASSKVLLRTNPVFNFDRPSSKIQLILNLIEKKILNTCDKAIVVSQWTSVLDIIQKHLTMKKIRCCCLNGRVAVKNRNDIVINFNNPNTPERIMLLSLTAGGVGLNLVGANHLILVDLHWNPQLESQAQDRIYRFGQKKPVHIYKFMCKDTVEERIKKLQDHKLDIANGVLTGVKAQSDSKLTLDDLKSIFGMS